MDFIGPINPPSSLRHKWILTSIDYFTKWIEFLSLKDSNETSVLNFYQDIVPRFGVPDSIIFDNALDFVDVKILEWDLRNNIYLNTSYNYFPHGNGQAKLTNKIWIWIIRRIIKDNQRAWYKKLNFSLWDDRITTTR